MNRRGFIAAAIAAACAPLLKWVKPKKPFHPTDIPGCVLHISTESLTLPTISYDSQLSREDCEKVEKWMMENFVNAETA